MRLLTTYLFASTMLFLVGCGGNEESKGSEDSKAKAMAECESFTKYLHDGEEGFKITEKRADPRDEVKLALDEKYESETVYISSITYEVNGEEKFCTCYIDENFDIINKEDLKTE